MSCAFSCPRLFVRCRPSFVRTETSLGGMADEKDTISEAAFAVIAAKAQAAALVVRAEQETTAANSADSQNSRATGPTGM